MEPKRIDSNYMAKALGAQKHTPQFPLEWFQSLSDHDLKGVTRLEVTNVENGLPDRTRALLVALAERLEDKK